MDKVPKMKGHRGCLSRAMYGEVHDKEAQMENESPYGSLCPVFQQAQVACGG